MNLCKSGPWKRIGLVLAWIFLAGGARACTIFTLIDANRALFCNNEDWKDPETRIWFVPTSTNFWSGGKRYGCAYVGFRTGPSQGGVNTEGLAFDWVAGYKEKGGRDLKMKSV